MYLCMYELREQVYAIYLTYCPYIEKVLKNLDATYILRYHKYTDDAQWPF